MIPSHPNYSRYKAFTMVEMLVALFIAGVVMTFVLTLHSNALRVSSGATYRTNAVASATAVVNIFRRDITGVIPLPDYATTPEDFCEFGKYDSNSSSGTNYDYTREHKQDSEIFWEAPIDSTDLSKGFRRISFFAQPDGSRLRLTKDVNGTPENFFPDSLAPYNHALVTWAARSGTAFRQVGKISLSVSSTDLASWFPTTATTPTPQELQLVALNAPAFENASGDFKDIGSYRGVLYARTSELTSSKTLELKANNEIIPGILIAGVGEYNTAPPWVLANFEPIVDIDATDGIAQLEVGSQMYNLYRMKCITGSVTIGEIQLNEEILLLIEPLFWSVGDDVEDMIFYPPLDMTDGDTTNNYELTKLDTGIYTSPIPPWIDVEVTIRFDPNDPQLSGRRKFRERIRIPTGRKL